MSRDRTGLELGIQRQQQDIDAHAAAQGLTIKHRYVDNDESAYKVRRRGRPQYREMMAAVERGEVDCIIVWHSSRLWRNGVERAAGIETLRKHAVSLMAVKGPTLDMSTAYGRGLAGLMGEFDSLESALKTERQQREMLQRVEAGKPPTGPRCYGYTAKGDETVPDEADDVRWMFGQVLAGATLSGIAADLNKRGRPNRNGEPWSHNAVRGVLLNERYAALREYRGQLYPGKWPPIITEDTWRAARHVLEDDGRATSPGPGRRWLLSGIAWCGVCAADGIEETMTSGSRGSRAAGGTVQPIYRCRRVKHLARFTDPIDDLVEQYVIARVSRPDAAGLLVDQEAPDMAELRAKAVALRGRQAALAAEFAEDDDADPRAFREASRRLADRLAEVEAQMVHPQRSRILAELVGAQDPEAAWLRMALDRQRSVVDTLAEVTILPGRPGRAPFDPATVRIVPREGMA